MDKYSLTWSYTRGDKLKSYNINYLDNTANDVANHFINEEWTNIFRGYKFKNKYRVDTRLLHQSSQAEIYICDYHNKKYIVKLYSKDMNFNYNLLDKLKTVFDIDKEELIVPIIDEGYVDNRRFEVMPYYSRGDLSKYGKMSYADIKYKIIPFINKALQIIHQYDIVHMDIKPSNIFMDNQGKFHLGDFGISSVIGDMSNNITSIKGTLAYRPPESYADIYIRSIKTDLYGWGMSLIYFWTGKEPFDGYSQMQIVRKTLDGQIPIPNDMPDNLKILISGLTAYDKKQRWDNEDVLLWINGRPIDKTSHNNISFLECTVFSIYDLVRAVTQSTKYWAEGVYRFQNGLFDDFFKRQGDNMYAVYKKHQAIIAKDEIKYISDDTYKSSMLVDDKGISILNVGDTIDYERLFCKLLLESQLQMNLDKISIGWSDRLFLSFDELATTILDSLLIEDLDIFSNDLSNNLDADARIIQQMYQRGVLEDIFNIYLDYHKISAIIYLDCRENLYKWSMHMMETPYFYYKNHKITNFEQLIHLLTHYNTGVGNNMDANLSFLQEIDRLMNMSIVKIWFLEYFKKPYDMMLNMCYTRG